MITLPILKVLAVASLAAYTAEGIAAKPDEDKSLDAASKDDEDALQPPLPITNPATWVTSADYPRWALYSNVEGVVRFALTVSASGTVENCEITETSKVLDLDNAACESLLARAQFLPARNAEGTPVKGVWRNSIRWQIPSEQMVPESGLLETSYVVAKDGRMTDCRTVRIEGYLAKSIKVESVCPDRSFIPPLDGNGNPVRKKVTSRMIMEVEDLPD